MQPHDLGSLFNRFAGKEVPMHEVFDGNTGKTVSVSILDRDVIRQMEKVAKDNGLELRVWFPGVKGARDVRNDRVNARIDKEADGKWRIAGRFYFG